MDTLLNCCRPVFGRHETFHPRWGWYSKAVTEARKNPFIFQENDAPLQLGVGKNMVRAIRYWGEASTLLKEVKPPKERLAGSSPTLRGNALLDLAQGVDPYLELKGSLWLLHWWMLHPIPASMVPLSWFAFNVFRPQEFNARDLEQAFFEECLKGGGDWKPVNTTLDRDSSCFLRTYVATTASQIDDALDAPLRELGLLAAVHGQKRRYRFQSPPWLDPHIILYCCADFLIATQHGGQTVTLTRLLNEINSPGKVLRLSEDQLITHLSDTGLSRWVTLTENIGAIQLVLKAPLRTIRWESLASYYGCEEAQAQALAEGGSKPLYSPCGLVDQLQSVKHARIAAKAAQFRSEPNKRSKGTQQRMALATDLTTAGLR